MSVRTCFAAFASVLLIHCGTQQAQVDPGEPDTHASAARLGSGDSWEPLVQLRDDTATNLTGKPAGGWWVTPIHANLRTDGKVLITGWGRIDEKLCAVHHTRQNGVTFLLDPATLAGPTLMVTPIDEHGVDQDVLYCSGHAPLPGGRVLFTGGARYRNLGEPGAEIEDGLDYARLYDSASGTFTALPQKMAGGPQSREGWAWYPTNTRLPSGDLLVMAGFTGCCNGMFANLSVQLFRVGELDAGRSPFLTLVNHTEGWADMAPGLRDYTHAFVLPRPVMAGGLPRQVAMMGYAGRTLLFNADAAVPANQRFVLATAAQRPGNVQAWDSSAALLSTGELLTLGGTADPSVAQRADLYDPQTGNWRQLDTGIGRHNPATVLLPDGTVLLLNGGNDEHTFAGDRRQPQVLDPASGTITTYGAWTGDANERGYHNFALLLKDGRVLLGGGISSLGGIGCERPDLRIWRPAYLSGARPVLSVAEPLSMQLGGPDVDVAVTGGALKSLVLMALPASTHSFDQNQRYVPLTFTLQGSTAQVQVPSTASVAPVGDYLLFAVSQQGTVSEGKHVQLSARPPDFRRTVIFIGGQTQPGQDMFVRGGIDHGAAAARLGVACNAQNMLCALPIHHLNLRNATTAPWKANDNFLDWYGAEPMQSPAAQGTAADWTTNAWTFGDPKRTVAVDGYGEEPLNTWGDHYWMVDVEMDCSRAIDGVWFEVKSFISNGPGWEPDVSQAGAPYASGNHFAKCGMVNRFERGSAAAQFIAFP
jgi:hypothetical protein